MQEVKLLWLPSHVRMGTGLTCVLSADILANFLRIYPCPFGIDVYLKVLGDCVDEVAEVWPHLDHNQIFPALLARPAVHLRNQVELLQREDGGKI